MTEIVISGLLAAVVGVVSSIVTLFTTRRTARAGEITAKSQADDTIVKQWQDLYKEVLSRVDDLEKKVQVHESRTQQQESIIRELSERELQSRIDLDAVFGWIEGGMKPPPPERPIYLTQNTRK